MSRSADPRTKIDLLRAAEAVFAEHGLAAAKVEDITARAGISKGAFYLHFESKDDCWRHIIEGFMAKLATCLDPPPETLHQGPSTVAELLNYWHQHDVEIFEFCWQNRTLFKMVLSGGGGTVYAYLADEFADRVATLIEAWVRHASAVGIYREDLDPKVAAALISGAYDRLMRELLQQPRRPDIPAWCRQALDLFMRGLLTNEARVIVDRRVSENSRTAKVSKNRPSSNDASGRGKRAKVE